MQRARARTLGRGRAVVHGGRLLLGRFANLRTGPRFCTQTARAPFDVGANPRPHDGASDKPLALPGAISYHSYVFANVRRSITCPDTLSGPPPSTRRPPSTPSARRSSPSTPATSPLPLAPAATPTRTTTPPWPPPSRVPAWSPCPTLRSRPPSTRPSAPVPSPSSTRRSPTRAMAPLVSPSTSRRLARHLRLRRLPVHPQGLHRDRQDHQVRRQEGRRPRERRGRGGLRDGRSRG